MPNTNYNGNKPHVHIGTIGHFGHGKTTLTAAITDVLAQRVGGNTSVPYESIHNARVETEDRVKISVSRVEYETNNRHYAHVDCPRRDDIVKNMITSTDQMDGAILVVDATNGVMAETVYHIRLARRMGVPFIVVFMNKCDMVDDTDLLESTEQEIRELLNQFDYPGDETPIIRGSAQKALEGPSSQWGDKIIQLMDAVDQWIPTPRREEELPFLMSVKNVFSYYGRGTIAEGRVERGTLRIRDAVQILDFHGDSTNSIVTNIEMFGRSLNEAKAGENIKVLLEGVYLTDIKDCNTLVSPYSVTCHKRFFAQVYVLSSDEGGRRAPIQNFYRPQIHFRASDVTGTCELAEGEVMCMPGDNMEMMIELIQPIPLENTLRFLICEGGRTVAVGKVLGIFE